MYRDRGRYSDSVTIPTVRATRTFRNDIESGKPRFLLKTLGSSRRASMSGSRSTAASGSQPGLHQRARARRRRRTLLRPAASLHTRSRGIAICEPTPKPELFYDSSCVPGPGNYLGSSRGRDSSILRARKTYNTPAQGVNASCLHAPAT